MIYWQKNARVLSFPYGSVAWLLLGSSQGQEDFNPGGRAESDSPVQVPSLGLLANANQARASCADGSTMSWVIPVTRPTIVASDG